VTPSAVLFKVKAYLWSLLQNQCFVEDLFAQAGDLKEVRAAISGMMRLPNQTS
jgi:hypothetical protein